MKKLILSSVIAISFLASCGGNEDKSKTDSATTTTTEGSQVASVKYQCPMKCEGEKTYDTAGKCPKCQMDMKEMK